MEAWVVLGEMVGMGGMAAVGPVMVITVVMEGTLALLHKAALVEGAEKPMAFLSKMVIHR